MECDWEGLLGILPQRLRGEVDALGRDSLRELRLRVGRPPELNCGGAYRYLGGTVTAGDLQTVVSLASRYSPWAQETAAQGYLTTAGGHRVGLCGETVCTDGRVTALRHPDSLCIRVARDREGAAAGLPECTENVLIVGPPGWGKTTLLRDYARRLAEKRCVGVVDIRKELFPAGFRRGAHMDVLSGCPLEAGIDWLLRTMGTAVIAVDEITASADCEALQRAVGCGVQLLASAHAGSLADLKRRPVYAPLLAHSVFQRLVLLKPDFHYTMGRMDEWS